MSGIFGQPPTANAAKYLLEIYHEGECIEKKEYPSPMLIPAVGDKIFIDSEKAEYAEKSANWWVVRSKRILFFEPAANTQTLQLFCSPDSAKGAII